MIRPGIRRLFDLRIRRRDLTDQDVDEELRMHIELRAEQLEREGMPPEVALAEAQKRFGSADAARQALRRTARRRDKRLHLRDRLFDLLRDVRYAGRAIRRSPLYALGVAGTLGLGLAAATLVAAMACPVWLTPLPLPNPDRIVRLYEVEPGGNASSAESGAVDPRRHPVSPALLEDLRSNSWSTIQSVSAVLRSSREWTRDGEAQSVSGLLLSPDGFGILGIVPLLGRLPELREGEVLLSEQFWRTDFGADPDVVGTEMALSSGSPIVVGIARLPHGYPGHADVVETLEWTGSDVEEERRNLRFVDAIARVRSGRSVEEAEAELNSFLTAHAETYPIHRGWDIEAAVLADALTGPFRGVLALLLAAGATFLLLGCVNVTGLVAARRVEGRHERAIRLALGASEGRLLRSSLVESLTLAVAASLAAVLAAYWLLEPMRALVPQDVPRLEAVAVTPPLALTVLAAGTLLGVAIGLAGYLASRGAGPAVGRAPSWRAMEVGGRRALVVGQVALTTLLTAGGATILQRVHTLRAVDLGFEPEAVWATSTALAREQYPSVEARWNVWRSILDGLATRGLPAAAAYNTPMSDDEMPPFGIRPAAGSEEVFSEFHYVSPDYFRVMGIRLLAGRTFGLDDRESAPRVGIVSQSFVDRYYPAGTQPREVVGLRLGPSASPVIVVGVVEPTRHAGPDTPVIPDLYVPLSQSSLPAASLLVRGDQSSVVDAVSAVTTSAVPGLRWTPLVQYTSYLTEWFAPLRLQLLVLSVLGILGLLLASLGLHSLLAYQVATRRKEIAIRKAVGASAGRLVRGVVLGGAGLALVGALLGLVAWYPLLPWARKLVDGIDPAGTLLPIVVVLFVGGFCLLATLLPAARAARVDPAVTLRVD